MGQVLYVEGLVDFSWNHASELGRHGETLAADFLRANGYVILAQNWRYSHLELDIVALRDSVLHVVEVKTRAVRVGSSSLFSHAGAVSMLSRASSPSFTSHSASSSPLPSMSHPAFLPFGPDVAMTPQKAQKVLLAAQRYIDAAAFEGEMSLDLIAIDVCRDTSQYNLRHYTELQWCFL